MDIHMEVLLVMGTGMGMTVGAVPKMKMVRIRKCMHPPPPSRHIQAMDTDTRMDIQMEGFLVMGTGMGLRESVRGCERKSAHSSGSLSTKVFVNILYQRA
jgi:hypothetical protein